MKVFFVSLILLVSCQSVKTGLASGDSKVFHKLKSLNYYKYAEKKHLEYAKQYLANEPSLNKFVPTSYFEDSFVSISKRHYYMDGEWLWDKGGMEKFLNKELVPYYKATGFSLEIQDIREELNEGIANYALIVNNKEYLILDNHKISGADVWGLVPLGIAKLINDQLQLQGFKDRLYLISAGNDGSGIFLTKKQHIFVYDFVRDIRWKPYDILSWKELYFGPSN